MTWDYIVIGAGSSGCALACELMRIDPTQRVLILEAGGPDSSPFIKFPAGQGRAMASHDWGYSSQPDPSRNGAVESWLRGRVLGGSSSINGTMFVRGASTDFDRWSRQLNGADTTGWSARDVLPIFQRLETSDQNNAFRGRQGPLHVRTIRKPHPVTRAFVDAVCANGVAFNEDYNGASQQGVAYAQLSQRNGLRCSAADAFLRPLLGNRNVKLLLNAAVTRIDFDKARATAVSFAQAGKQCREAARDVVVCAGAINTPKLLMLSGIGDAEELRRHGIDVVVPLPGVGRNLQEHPLLGFTYRAKAPTYNLTGGIRQRLGIVATFVTSREGPISNLFEGVAFLKSSPSESRPDIQLHFLPVGYVTRRGGAFELTPYPAVTVLLNKSYPSGRGRISLASNRPEDAPLIECRLLEEEDVETMVRGVDVVRTIMNTEPMASLLEGEVAPGPHVTGTHALKEYVRSNTGIGYHPIGTCRLGADADAVVGADLRVHGTDNLWVADASVMPSLISGNTNAACMMIGAKLGSELQMRRRA